MVTFTGLSRRAAQMLCLLTSVVIVASGLFAGTYAAKQAEQRDYSVTITQLQ